MRQLYPYKGKSPVLDPTVFVAPGAVLVGDVTAGEGSAFWYNVAVRADVNYVKIGKFCNIQDGTVIHEDSGKHSKNPDGLPTVLGDYVSVGHNVILHACRIDDYVLVGMGATVMDGSHIGKGSVIGAGALITKDTEIPPFSVVMGAPAKVVRTLPETSIADRLKHAMHYHELAQEHMEELAALGED